MKSLCFSLILSALVMSSCVTKQKASSRNDDVYYSPAKKQIDQKTDTTIFLKDTTVFLSNAKETKTIDKELFQRDIISIGVGTGPDYGTIGYFNSLGANLTIFPLKKVGIFGAVGKTFKLTTPPTEYNVGIKYNFSSEPAFWGMDIVAMYGYNIADHVSGAPEYDKSFLGPTLGISFYGRGIYKENPTGFYLSWGFFVAIASEEAKKYYDVLENNPNITLNEKALPIRVSLGIGYCFGSKKKIGK
jgi:hypothetical protein